MLVLFLALAVALTGCGAAPQAAVPVKEAPLAAVEQAAPAEAPAQQAAEKPASRWRW